MSRKLENYNQYPQIVYLHLPNTLLDIVKLLGNIFLDLLPNNIYNYSTLLGKGQIWVS